MNLDDATRERLDSLIASQDVTLFMKGDRRQPQCGFSATVVRILDSLIPEYTKLVYNGFWFAPEREILQGMMDDIQKGVTGVARLKLYKGSAMVVGRKAERSLYREDFATFESDEVYDQADAEGFIKLNALRLRIARMMKG